MRRISLPALTSENLRVRVQVDDDATDPTAFPVHAAWTATDAAPGGGDWVAASWAAGGPPYRALVLASKPAGTYMLWVRVTAGGETPVRKVGIVDFE